MIIKKMAFALCTANAIPRDPPFFTDEELNHNKTYTLTYIKISNMDKARTVLGTHSGDYPYYV
jgi:hypothetical protein